MNCTLLIRMYSSGSLPTIKKSAKLIRNEFLDYFKKDLSHNFVRSSPVISFNDHTVAFVNAGMNQFKGVFLDYYDAPGTKVTNSQKCIRITGKHNDLNTVGNDSYHHTFFEMLGNWSFGDYFKEEACRYAWDLLTKRYGINEESLYVTYFGGDEKLELPADLECRDVWLSIGVKKDKILPFGLQENFWEMGVSGPCGPCTEIHVDHTKQLLNRSAEINKGYSNLTELWNIVFIQYERLLNGAIVPLSKHHVDTGMGFERLVALLQGKQSNYDTDLFQPLFKSIQRYAKVPEYKGQFYDNADELDSGYRVLADHSRMITVALADGVVPEHSNKLRRIIRKSIDIGEKVFKKQGIIPELSYVVAETLGDAYPELETNLKKVQKIIRFEEELYKKLRSTSGEKWNKVVEKRPSLKGVTEWLAPGLVDGYKYLQGILNDLKVDNVLPGCVAFKLYDTYGLRVETINELAKIESLDFDEAAFQEELESLKSRSRVGLEKISVTVFKKSLEVLEENHMPRTDDSFKYKFVFNGYNYKFPKIESKVLALILNDTVILNNAKENTIKDTCLTIHDEILKYPESEEDEIGIILDRTMCYSAEGGQASDIGTIQMQHMNFNVTNVKKIDGYVIHYGKLLQNNLKEWIEELKTGNNCTVSIEPESRIGMMQHHTAAHLLNAFIQNTMQAVYSRNSVVLPHSLKCQFNSFGEKLSFEKIREIEERINDVIRANVPVTTKVLNALELLAEDSVTLIPGEIYPYKNIRLVEINCPHVKSKEACCGTHILKTGGLRYFCFLDYSSRGAANLTLKAVVGTPALIAKLTGEKMQRTILELEKKLKIGEITRETYKSLSKEIADEIKDNKEISYVSKEECSMKLRDLNKFMAMQEKEMGK
ncbi:alanine--tRNA ligase, mitochondrial isoform X3 [Ceratina calcarata]|nr:alanine--tRNA ligase, mitochondrial isoform X3 [Ceratina calcarata]